MVDCVRRPYIPEQKPEPHPPIYLGEFAWCLSESGAFNPARPVSGGVV